MKVFLCSVCCDRKSTTEFIYISGKCLGPHDFFTILIATSIFFNDAFTLPGTKQERLIRSTNCKVNPDSGSVLVKGA